MINNIDYFLQNIVCEQYWWIEEDNTTELIPLTGEMKKIIDTRRISIQKEMKKSKYFKISKK